MEICCNKNEPGRVKLEGYRGGGGFSEKRYVNMSRRPWMRGGTHKEQTGRSLNRRPSGCAAGRQTSGSETVLGRFVPLLVLLLVSSGEDFLSCAEQVFSLGLLIRRFFFFTQGILIRTARH